MSNSQAELQGHSHKDESDQGLHQRPNIPQSKGLGERSRVNTFSAYFKMQARARCQHKAVKAQDRRAEATHVVCIMGRTISTTSGTRLKEKAAFFTTYYNFF